MRDKMRKSYQNKFNKLIKELNKSIAEDSLWRGRFVFLQNRSNWFRFEDNSGGELIVFVRAYDKKTGYYCDYRVTYAPWLSTFMWHLSMDVANDFIVNKIDVWKEDPRPSINDNIDYTKVNIDIEKLKRKPWNFFASAKDFDFS